MEKYEIGDVWWVHFPFEDKDQEKRRPAIIVDDETIMEKNDDIIAFVKTKCL